MCAYGHPGAAICDFQAMVLCFGHALDSLIALRGCAHNICFNLCLATLIPTNNTGKFDEKT